jgi:hypothetical protein
LSGCDDPCEDLALTEPALEIGTGWQSFTPMGYLTYFERGSQGGYHVYASVRASGLFSGPTTLVGKKTPYLTYTLQSEDETLTGGFTDVQRRMTVLPDGRIERLGDLAILSSYNHRR